MTSAQIDKLLEIVGRAVCNGYALEAFQFGRSIIEAAREALDREAAQRAKENAAVVLLGHNDGAKIPVIKAIREITSLGLKEAKDLVEGALPKRINESPMPHEVAAQAVAQLRDAGARVALEPFFACDS